MFGKRDDVLIASASLGLTGLLRLSLGLCPWMTMEVYELLFFGDRDGSPLRTTDLRETLGQYDRNTCCKVLGQMPAITHLPGLWSAFLDR